ncbi:MAG: TolC family protein [Flavobacteriales bacterium]|nr:TolC family protein [Flavobacteriales bacterium]
MRYGPFNLSLFALSIVLCTATADAQQPELTIDLATALEFGGARNLTVQEQRALQDAAEADLAKASEWWLPELSVGTSINTLNGTAMNADGRFFLDVDRQNFSAGGGVLASWDFRNGPADVKAARLRGAAQELAGKQNRNEALLAVVQTYYALATADAETRALEHLSKLADSVAMQLGLLVEIGSAYTSDHLLARSNHAQLRIRVQRSRSDRAEASARLAALLDLDPLIRFTVTDTVLAPIDLPGTDQPAAVSDSLQLMRPDLMAMRLELDALSAERKRTTTGLLMPQLRVGAGYSAFGDVFQPLWPTGEVNAALLWRIPLGRIFQAGDLKQANARLELQQLSLRRSVAIASADVEAARQQVEIARVRLELARAGASDAEEAFAQTMTRQRLGLVRPMETLQAQETAAEMLVERIRATAELNALQYRLKVALGGEL